MRLLLAAAPLIRREPVDRNKPGNGFQTAGDMKSKELHFYFI